MKTFFDGVGDDYASGIWEEQPVDRPDFKAKYARALEIQAKKRAAAEEAV